MVCAELTDSLGAVEMIGEEDSDVLRSPDATDLLDAVVGLVATRCRHAASPDTLSSDTVLDLISVGSSAGTADRYWTLDPMAADPVAVRVAAPASLAEARLCESVESGHSNQDHSAQIAALLGITAEPYRIDSQCKYAAVARRDVSIYLRLPTRADYREKIWDHAVGKFVVEQAGGVVTDVTGAPLDFSCGATLAENRGVIAADGRFHTQVVDAVRAVLA